MAVFCRSTARKRKSLYRAVTAVEAISPKTVMASLIAVFKSLAASWLADELHQDYTLR